MSTIAAPIFQNFIDKVVKEDKIIVQPRMGFSSLEVMRSGLLAFKNLKFPVIGTITIDSFTRTKNFKAASKAIKICKPLNGYPIVSYSNEENISLISDVISKDYPIQIRHGSPQPEEIFKATMDAGIDAIEGGPISYCLPYSRVSLKDSVKSWVNCSQMYAEAGNGTHHIESFGGCMLGQLCPPSMLITITILEVLFFNFYGINSVSASLTQGTNSQQDIAALKALKRLCNKFLETRVDWHIVYYTYMGKFPETIHGAKSILKESAIIAKQGGARRIIVKTVNEAHQIPSIQDNIDALKLANIVASKLKTGVLVVEENPILETQIYNEANCLLEAILNLSNDISIAIQIAFNKGYLDVPFCLHQSNKRKSSSSIDALGNIVWTDLGNIPIKKQVRDINFKSNKQLTSNSFLKMLSFNQYKFDYNENLFEI